MTTVHTEKSIVHLASSICKNLGLPSLYPSIPEIDMLRLSAYKNVVLLVVDGMGTSILEENGTPHGFFQSHLLFSADSVVPSTTVAATTSLKTGRWPIETGWLGWSLWIDQLEELAAFFKNAYAHSDVPLPEENMGERLIPYQPITEMVERYARKGMAIGNFTPPYLDDIDSVCERIERECAGSRRTYIYAYVKNPDYTMHRTGVHSESSIGILRHIEERVEQMCSRLKETIVLITADHGHMDVEGICLQDCPELADCFPLHPHGDAAISYVVNSQGEKTKGPALDVRTLAFFVRPEAAKPFEERFLDRFGKDFLLYPTRQALQMGLFGPLADPSPGALATLGDYIALGVGNKALYYTREETAKYIGHHSGFTQRERKVPVIVVETDS